MSDTSMKRFLFGAALAAFATLANAAPKPYSAEYEVLRNGDRLGRATVTLREVGDGRWELLSVTRGTEGLAALAGIEITERSLLRWQGDRPETIEYSFAQQMAWDRKERSVRVDPAGKRILSRDKRGEHDFAYKSGALDRQAATLALAQDVAAGKRGALVYDVVDRANFEPERYRVAGEESVQTPAGTLAAIKVERVREDGGGRTTTLWLGKAQNYLPVRTVQREPDGESFEMRLIQRTDD